MPRRLQPGDAAPAFTLPTTAGGEVHLADYYGRMLVLVFNRWLG